MNNIKRIGIEERRATTSIQNVPLEAKKSHDCVGGGEKEIKTTSLEKFVTYVSEQLQEHKYQHNQHECHYSQNRV